MKVKMIKKPQYPEIEVIGMSKEDDPFPGTMPYRPGERIIITEEDVDIKYVHRESGLPFRKVDKVESIELYVELAGGFRSLANFTLDRTPVYVAPNAENDGMIDVFVNKDCCIAGYEYNTWERKRVLDQLYDCANAMCAKHPESAGLWRIIDKEGRRVVIRNITEKIRSKADEDFHAR